MDFTQYFAPTFIPIWSALAADSPSEIPFAAGDFMSASYQASHDVVPTNVETFVYEKFTQATASPFGNLSPTPSIAPPGTVQPGVAVVFDSAPSRDPDGSITQVLWEFGDGAMAVGPSATHAFTGPGTYDVTLTVLDDAGDSASTSYVVRVGDPGIGNTHQGANVVVTPRDVTTGTSPLTVTFPRVFDHGTTVLETSASGPQPPPGQGAAVYLRLVSTAKYGVSASEPVNVCVRYDRDRLLGNAPPRLYRWDTRSWADVTGSEDVLTQTTCGTLESLSTLALFEDIEPPTLAIAATPNAIWPPDGNPVPVTMAVEVADGADATPRVRLMSIVANAPDPLAGVADALFGEDDRAFTLAAVQGRVYQITYQAEDAAGNTTRATAMAAVNRAPTVEVFADRTGCHPRPTAPCQISLTASASDPDGDPLTYAWQGCASGSSATVSCAVTTLGQTTARVTVSDPKGGNASAQVAVVGRNKAPVVTASAGSSSSCHPNCTTNVSATASDANGDPLTYSWSGCASGTSAATTCAVTQMGENTALVTVSDGWVSVQASAVSTGVNIVPTILSTGSREPILCGATTCAWNPNTQSTLEASIADDDSDGGSCTATASGSCNSASCYAVGRVGYVTMWTDSGPGTCRVDVRWTDRWGASSAVATDWYPVTSTPP